MGESYGVIWLVFDSCLILREYSASVIEKDIGSWK